MQKRNRKDRKRHQAEQEARQKVDDARLYEEASAYLHANISEACLHTPPGTTMACPTGCGCWCDACEATRKNET